MGQVYEARHHLTGRRVALKRVSAGALALTPGAEQRVLDEAAACGALRHPGVVEILDAGRTEEGDLFLVFEYLDGQNLELALRQRRVAPKELVRLAARLLGALGAVHDAGWVHRDVKPSNVFLARGRSGPVEVKLLDFGIATRLGAPPDERPLMGTIEYMSPEQATGDPCGVASDLWSVGALLHRGLVDRPPWPARVPSDRRHSLVSAPPDLRALRPELPADLAAVVARALEPLPERRWASAEVFASALLAVRESALATLGPPAAPPAGPRADDRTEPAWLVDEAR